VRGRLTAAALAVVSAVLLPAAAPAESPAPTLRAGAARVPLPVPPGTPLAGYGSVHRRLIVPDVFGLYPHAFWFKPADGSLDELAVRALVLYQGETRVTWLAADLIAVDQAFTRRLSERLVASGIRAGTLIVSASHTHSGPGAYLRSALFGVAAVDREDPTVRDAVVDTMIEAVRRAGSKARDARLAVATIEAPPVTRSRLGGDVDREVVVLKLTTTDGEPVAALWNYAIHGTMLGPRNRRLSGDVMGVASRAIEGALGVPALFVNGAVGDVSPLQHGEPAQESTGRALADAVRAAWAGATPEPAATPPLVVRTARVRLPAPSVSVRHCVARWMPARVRVPLGRFLPDETELVAVSLGRAAWVTMPGEPVTALGREIKDAARQRWPHAFVAGLSNDYLGYFVRPDDYTRTGYVTCAAVYGPQAGTCLIDAALTLLDDLSKDAPKLRRPVRATSPCDVAARPR
jgi:hypothetical protein